MPPRAIKHQLTCPIKLTSGSFGFLDRFCCTDHSFCRDLAKIGRLNFQTPCLHQNLHPLHCIVNHSADTIALGRRQNKKSANLIYSIPTALAKEMPLQFEFFSSFSNSLMNIMKSQIRTNKTTLSYSQFAKEKSVILWFILTAASTRSYILLIILRSLPCNPF